MVISGEDVIATAKAEAALPPEDVVEATAKGEVATAEVRVVHLQEDDAEAQARV